MKKTVLFILLAIIALSSCKKYVEVKDLDKEEIVDFPIFSVGYSTYRPDFTTLPAMSYLIDFDKRDYPKVDSITLNVILTTAKTSDTSFVRLFNVTDNVAIDNSTLSASTPYPGAMQINTNNLYNLLPNKRATYALQVKSAEQGGVVSRVFLKLRRN